MKIVKIFIFTSFALAGCKAATDNSKLASLDNFASASGKITTNKCQGIYTADKKAMIIGSEKHKAIVKKTLTAIHPKYQRMFFNTYGGAIAVDNNFDKNCGRELSKLSPLGQRYVKEGQAEASSCITERMGHAIIYLKPEKTAIEHGLVRAFAYWYGKMVAPLKFSKNWYKSLGDLMAVFHTEVRDSNGKYSLAAYDDLLKSTEGTRVFANYVFAEAFDSYYCSDRTRDVFRSDFSQTYASFGIFAKYFESK